MSNTRSLQSRQIAYCGQKDKYKLIFISEFSFSSDFYETVLQMIIPGKEKHISRLMIRDGICGKSWGIWMIVNFTYSDTFFFIIYTICFPLTVTHLAIATFYASYKTFFHSFISWFCIRMGIILLYVCQECHEGKLFSVSFWSSILKAMFRGSINKLWYTQRSSNASH